MHPTAYSDPMGNGNIFCLYSGGTVSQGGCAAKGQTVAKFEQLFGEQINGVTMSIKVKYFTIYKFYVWLCEGNTFLNITITHVENIF